MAALAGQMPPTPPGNVTPPQPSSASGTMNGVSLAAVPSSYSASSSDRSFSEYLHDHFDLVFKRVTMGRRDLKSVKAYLETRGSLEKSFADKLSKDGHATPELTDSSSTGPVWSAVKDSAAQIGAQHAALSALCSELALTLDKTIKELKTTKTSLQARYLKLTDDCRTKQTRHDRARDAYADNVKSAESAIHARENGRNLPQPQQQKLDNNVSRALGDLSKKHEEYRRAVQTLKDAQVNYDAQMVDIMQAFEKVETDRLRVFTDVLGRYTSGHEQMVQGEGAVVAGLRTSVGTIDNRRDIQEYIGATTTNTKPKPHVEYHAISNAVIEATPGGAAALGRPVGSTSSAYPPAPMTNMQPVAMGAPQMVPVLAPANSNGGVAAPPAGVIGGVKFIPPPVSEHFVPPPVSHGAVAVALFDFDSAEPDDLTFKAGEVISLKQSDDSEDWWMGELRGRTGIFPKTYVRKEEAHSLPAVTAPGTASSAAPPSYSSPSAPPSAQVAPASVPTPAPVVISAPVPTPAPNMASGEGVPGEAGPGGMGAGAGGPGAPEQPREMDARCEALFDFVGQDVDELSFKKGDQLIITGELNGWYLGKIQNTNAVGIFPSNYVVLKE